MAGRRRSNRRSQNGGSHMPPPWLSGWFDPELKDLFEDEPELYQTAHLLRSSRPEAQADPQYRQRLRASLMAEAQGSLGRHRLRRWFVPGPGHLAWGGAAAGVALIGATALALLSGRMQDHQTIVAYSRLAAQHAVSPNDVITVAFNQPMDRAAVVAGLNIQPATQVTTTWKGNSLVITPVHHLAGNTPYTVTIAQPQLRTVLGTVAAAPVEITFGTAPTPPTTPNTASTPNLTPNNLGQAASGAGLLVAPDGSVVTTAGLSGTGTTSTPTPAPSASPGVTPTPGGSPSATPAPAPAPTLLEFPAAGGNPIVLGHRASAAAFAPGGGALAFAVADSHGGSQVIVARSDGTNPTVLTSSASPVVAVAWSSNARIVYATATGIKSVDVSGAAGPPADLPPGSGPLLQLSPNGRYAYLAPAAGADGTLLDLNSGTSRSLSGAVSEVAFAGDSKTVAWVDRSGTTPRLLTEPANQDTQALISTLNPGASLSLVALDYDGTEVAYVVTPDSGNAELVVAQLASGSPLAIGPVTRTAAFSRQGDALAYLEEVPGGIAVQLASIPGVSQPSVGTVPRAAAEALNGFVSAQVSGSSSALRTLSAPEVDAAGQTPRGLTRAYVIDAVLGPAGTVNATVELIVDANPTHLAPRVSSETLTLIQAATDGPFVVSAMNVTPLRNQASGPHIVHVSTAHGTRQYTVQVAFDSDLNPATVQGAITLVTAAGLPLPAVVTYDADTRTATLTLDSAPSGPVTVDVATSLRDINGLHLALPFQGTVAG